VSLTSREFFRLKEPFTVRDKDIIVVVQEKLKSDVRFRSMFQHKINTQANAASH
jgi:hypothetical protein